MASTTVPLIIHGTDVVVQNDGGMSAFPLNPDMAASHSSFLSAQGATKELCIKAVESCAKAFPGWSTTPLSERKTLFMNLADVLRKKADELRSLIHEELHCSQIWAEINVNDSISLAEHVASLSTSPVLSGLVPETRAPGSHALIIQAPLGVILGIAPWNAPAILGLRAVAAAVMAGNCAILKGSELSPGTHYFIAAAFRDAGFPPGVVNFLLHKPEDAPEVFETLISHPRVRKCNFTGSTAVGRQIAMRASHHLKPVLLELGGKNYAIVLEDANLEDAADMILQGALMNSGQICMSTDLVLVSKAVKQALCQILHARLKGFSDQHVTKLISAKADTRIEDLVRDAAFKGARIHSATSTHEAGLGEGRSQYARIIEDVTPNMAFWEQESFGPLLGIAACDGLEEAMGVVNDCPYGLSAAIFSRAGLELVNSAKRLNVGAVHINGATVHDEATLPHGGCKDSGWGRFGGHWALLEFVQTQTVIVN